MRRVSGIDIKLTGDPASLYEPPCRLYWVVWLVYVVSRYVTVIIGCVSEMYSSVYIDLPTHVLFYVKYISRRTLLIYAIFNCV